MPEHPVTPDGRYFVVRGRLWRCSNPNLPTATRQALVKELMSVRRAVRSALSDGGVEALAAARARVDEVKRDLGERGSAWWTDGAPDVNRHLVLNTSYALWFRSLGKVT